MCSARREGEKAAARAARAAACKRFNYSITTMSRVNGGARAKRVQVRTSKDDLSSRYERVRARGASARGDSWRDRTRRRRCSDHENDRALRYAEEQMRSGITWRAMIKSESAQCYARPRRGKIRDSGRCAALRANARKRGNRRRVRMRGAAARYATGVESG